MTFKELTKKGEEYFKTYCNPLDWEWYHSFKEAMSRGAAIEELDAIPYKTDYAKRYYNGCDIINAFNMGYWAAREELGLPRCD